MLTEEDAGQEEEDQIEVIAEITQHSQQMFTDVPQEEHTVE